MITLLTIGQLAKTSGVAARTIRYFPNGLPTSLDFGRFNLAGVAIA